MVGLTTSNGGSHREANDGETCYAKDLLLKKELPGTASRRVAASSPADLVGEDDLNIRNCHDIQ